MIVRKKSEFFEVSHIDTTPKFPIKEFEGQAVREMTETFGANQDSIDRGLLIAALTGIEFETRRAHDERYHILANGNTLSSRLTAYELVAETALIDFAAATDLTHSVETGKGISHELGYVAQLGDWAAAEALDEQIRMLRRSQALADVGMKIKKIYDGTSDPVRYSIHPVETFLPNWGHFDPRTTVVVRKKAIADFETIDGSQIEVIRRSSFKVPDDFLSDDEKETLWTADSSSAIKEQHREIGSSRLEPELKTDQRPDEIVPITSSYFALQRLDDLK